MKRDVFTIKQVLDMKIEPIEVYSSNLDDYLDLEIVAFHWAAGGACGEGGAVVFVTTDGKVYHSNYVYPGFITVDDLLRIFPALSEFSPGIMDSGTTWSFMNLSGIVSKKLPRKNSTDVKRKVRMSFYTTSGLKWSFKS